MKTLTDCCILQKIEQANSLFYSKLSKLWYSSIYFISHIFRTLWVSPALN